jgi:UDP-N-acetylglucosamine:LPS N-acetylglucosamine transferase
MPKLLILTANTGGGHVSLAEALRDLLADACDAEIVDPYPAIVRLHYRLVSRHAPAIWAAEYALSDTPRSALAAHKLAAIALNRRLAALLRRGDYDLVLSTFPFLSYEAVRAIRSLARPIPFVMLPSDPDRLHATWLTERGAAATFAPTRETYAQMLAAGFAPERLHLTGWPVRRQFCDAARESRAATLARLGLDPHCFTLFVQGGGEGSAGFARSVEIALAAAPDRIQIILATGTNRGLAERFSGAARVRAIPFTRTIAPLMAAADVVLGKAGPNALFEAVMLGKPFVATTYIPGQERANLAFIQSHGLGWVALDAPAQRQLLAALAANPGLLRSMEASVRRYCEWNAAAVASIPELVGGLVTRAGSSVATA